MKISFVIPFHNEEKNVSVMLERLITLREKHHWNAEIIPINDKSSDRTPNIIDNYAKKYPFIHPIHRKKRNEEKGNTMGESLREGTRQASGDVIVWTMGDCSDDPSTYQKIINRLNEGYDMVFGSRYMVGGSKGNLDSLKAFLSQWGTMLARMLFSMPVHDITNAFRGFKKEVFIKAKPTAVDFAISPEFAIRAQLAGFRLAEVPTTYYNRVEGVSNFKLYKMTVSYLSTYARHFFNYRILGKRL